MLQRLNILDHQLSTKLRAAKPSPFVSVVHRASQTGSYGVIWVLLFAVVATWLAGWKAAVVASACVLGSLMLNTLIKSQIERPRPADNPIGHQPTTHSMPSAHTVMAVVGATCMTIVAPAAAPLWWGWMLILAGSRVYLGMHYLGDVLVGAILGAIIASTIAWPLMTWAV